MSAAEIGASGALVNLYWQVTEQHAITRDVEWWAKALPDHVDPAMAPDECVEAIHAWLDGGEIEDWLIDHARPGTWLDSSIDNPEIAEASVEQQSASDDQEQPR